MLLKSNSAKKFPIFLGKAFISSSLIWYLLSRVELNLIYSALGSTIIFWLVLAFLSLFVGKFLTGYRWRVLLMAQGIKIPIKKLIAALFVGQFFNNFLPTTVGGDAFRAYATASYSKESAKSISTVFLDRLIGVFALVFLSVIAVGVGIGINQDVSSFVLPVMGIFSLCLLVFFLIFNRSLAVSCEKAMRRFHLEGIADNFHDAYRSLHDLKDKKLTLFIALMLSIALQINVVMFYYFVARSLDIGVPMLYFFIIIPITLIVLLLPFSINGIGLREGLFVFLLADLSVPYQESIALSWLAFVLLLTQGVLGGVLFVLRGIELKKLSTSRHY